MSEGIITVQRTLQGELAVQPTLLGEISSPSTLLGVLQPSTGYTPSIYSGEYEVVPKAYESQMLETKDKLLEENVLILNVPYFQTSNEHGDTVYIASEV